MKIKILSILAFVLVISIPLYATDALVTTEWLAANLNNPNVRVIEVSVEPGVFERGHIPGAVNFRWHTDLVDPIRRDIISKENFEKLLWISFVIFSLVDTESTHSN